MKECTIGLLAGLALCILSPSSRAQLPVPVLQSVFPPGAQAGTTVEVTIQGLFLQGASALIFSDSSLHIRSELITNEEMPEYSTQFRLTIPDDAQPGTYDLYAKCGLGLSAPRSFVIGSKPELTESHRNTSEERAMHLKPETVVNGRSDQNANDYYRIEAKAGETYVITCRAEDLDSRMDATLILCDMTDRELDRDRNNRTRDAVVSFTAPQDGSYFLRVADFTYGGGHDHPYRLALTAAPQIAFVFPPAGQPGTVGRFTLYGRNLPNSDRTKTILVGNRRLEWQEAEIALPANAATTRFIGDARSTFVPHFFYRHPASSLQSNPVSIGVASAPVVIEREDPDTAEQRVTIPCEIQGRFDRVRDRDRFRFSVQKGQQLWIGVLAERIGTPSDSSLRIERITGSADGVEQVQLVSSVDDLNNDPGERYFPLPCRDAAAALRIAEDGDYRITIMNQAGSGGPDRIYRLILREPRPEFDLIALPWTQNRLQNKVDILGPILRPGGSIELKVLALRHEGFNGEIQLGVNGLPPGVSCAPVKIKERSAILTLIAAPDAKPWDGIITVRGTSGGLVREASLGTIPWPINDWSKQFLETRLGPAIPLSVSGDGKAPVTVLTPEVRTIEGTIGDKLEIPVQLARNLPAAGEINVRLHGFPHKATELKLPADAESGTLVINSGNGEEIPQEPGTWTVRIRAEGTVNYQPSKATAIYARTLHQRIVAQKREHNDALEKLELARNRAQQQLDEAEKEPGDGGNQTGKVQALRMHLAGADEELRAAQETARNFQERILRASANVKSANDLVKPRDVRFVSYSEPITIRITSASSPTTQPKQ